MLVMGIYKGKRKRDLTLTVRMICYSNYNEVWANNVLNACGCQAALLYHIEFGNHYTCKFLFLYAQDPRASLD